MSLTSPRKYEGEFPQPFDPIPNKQSKAFCIPIWTRPDSVATGVSSPIQEQSIHAFLPPGVCFHAFDLISEGLSSAHFSLSIISQGESLPLREFTYYMFLLPSVFGL